MNFESKTWVAITLLMALITTLLVYNYLQGFQQKDAAEFKETVAAVQDIQAGTKLTPGMLKTVRIPAEYLHTKAVADVKEAAGMYTSVDLIAEEIILKPQLFAAKDSNEMPYRIPEGMRAVTIAVNTISGVAGQIKPGYRVDVLLNTEINGIRETFTFLQNIEVLAVGTQIEKKEGPQETGSITLAVDPDQAQRIALAESSGQMKVVLRSHEDDKTVNNGRIDLNWLAAQY